MATSTAAPQSSTSVAPGPSLQNLTNDDSNESDSWITTTSPRIAFLAFFILFGFLGNVLIITTLCHSRRFRSTLFYVLILNLAVVNICECVLNMSILLSSNILNGWTFGMIPCRLSAFFLNLVCIETVLGLTILTTDRMIAVVFKDKYDKAFSVPRVTILIFYTWIQSIAFSFPIAVGTVPASVNDYIFHCTIAKGSSLVYSAISTLFCFIIPFTLMVIFFIKIIRTGYRDRFLIRTLISQHNYKDECLTEPRIKQEIRHSNLSGTLCLTWLVLQGPHAVTYYLAQFNNSSELEDISKDELKYVWYVDLVLLWLRFSYPLALPTATFLWNKDLWKSFKDMILCRKNNAVIDESFRKKDTEALKLDRKIKEEKMKEREALSQVKEERVFQVPVLFATSHGVHIKTYDENETDHDEETEGESKSEKNLRGKKCDVIDSRDNLNNIGDDTSDYDSGNELDPFSVSHPICVKQLDSNLGNHQRSSSQPEVRDKINQKLNNTVGTYSNGDSGLDLSLGHTNSSPKTSFNTHSNAAFDKSEFIQNHAQSNNSLVEIDVNAKQLEKYNQKNTSEEKASERNSDIKHSALHGSVPSTPLKTVAVECTGQTIMSSPARKIKKRKSKLKNDDSRSLNSVSSSPLPPLRAPPRLAPLVSKNVQSNPGLSESRSSSQCSVPDTGPGSGHVNPVYHHDDSVKPDLNVCDNISVSSFSSKQSALGPKLKLSQNSNSLDSANNIPAVHECIHETQGVLEEVLTPSACTMEDKTLDYHAQCDSRNDLEISGDGSQNSEEEIKLRLSGTKVVNTEARRKRRERLAATTSSLLSDGKGYRRLTSD